MYSVLPRNNVKYVYVQYVRTYLHHDNIYVYVYILADSVFGHSLIFNNLRMSACMFSYKCIKLRKESMLDHHALIYIPRENTDI